MWGRHIKRDFSLCQYQTLVYSLWCGWAQYVLYSVVDIGSGPAVKNLLLSLLIYKTCHNTTDHPTSHLVLRLFNNLHFCTYMRYLQFKVENSNKPLKWFCLNYRKMVTFYVKVWVTLPFSRRCPILKAWVTLWYNWFCFEISFCFY